MNLSIGVILAIVGGVVALVGRTDIGTALAAAGVVVLHS